MLIALTPAQKGSIPPTPSIHRLRRGLPGYLILFAPHAFEPQCQLQSRKPPSPLVFLLINIVGKCLIIIGNNTLAIYLLHYFLLPHLPLIGNCIKDSSNVLCELMIIIPLSLLIISLSFLVAKVIRLSPILGKILLGDKG